MDRRQGGDDLDALGYRGNLRGERMPLELSSLSQNLFNIYVPRCLGL